MSGRAIATWSAPSCGCIPVTSGGTTSASRCSSCRRLPLQSSRSGSTAPTGSLPTCGLESCTRATDPETLKLTRDDSVTCWPSVLV